MMHFLSAHLLSDEFSGSLKKMNYVLGSDFHNRKTRNLF